MVVALSVAIVVTAFAEARADGEPFVTTWRTTTANESITIPTYTAFGAHTIDWGDGTAPTTAWFDQTHVYAEPGTYTVSITGDFTQIRLYDDQDNAKKLVSVDSWGGMRWASMDHAFGAASNMRYNATDAPDFSALTDLQYMFYSATSFNGDISGWDVSPVTNMEDMFNNADSFNGDLSSWNVSNARSMHAMFFGTDSFNGDISGWDVSSVTDMSSMFTLATSFNGNISGWDVSSVTDMSRMFLGASSFNQPLSSWDVSSVTDMTDMFSGAGAFDQNLGDWYIVLDDAAIDYGDAPGVVGRITAQNPFLEGQNPAYGIGAGGDSGSFELDGSNLVLKVAPTKGTYTVTITSTGGFGSGNSQTFDISVAGLNTPPSVDVGPDQTVTEGDTVALNGTATDQDAGDALTYLWTHNSTLPITLDDQNAADTTFAAPQVDADTPVTFILTVSDGTATATDQVTITIADSVNAVPSVDAGPDQTVTEGDTVALNGTATDQDAGDALTYLWTHNSTLPISIADQDAADTTFAAPSVSSETTIAFTLAVSDGTATASDTLLVTITDSDGGVTDTGNTASVAEVTSATPDGTYDIGDMIDVRISFTESVWLERYAIEDDRSDATGSGTFDILDYPISVTTIEIGGAIYALVAANVDDGIQIIDITDPANPAAVSSVTDGAGGFDTLDGASSVDTTTIGGSHYALVAADTDDGVQIIDITDPANPVAVSSVTDGAGGFDTLDGASSVDTTTIGGSHYALVAADTDDGVQIIDITDPANPVAVSSVTDGAGGFDMLDGASSVDTTTIGGSHYALVAADTDDGVQIIDITDPANPAAVSSVTDGAGGFDTLNGASSVDTATIGNRHYALVAAFFDDGVQIIDITDPANPVAASKAVDGRLGFNTLGWPKFVTTETVGDSHYALVSAVDDKGIQIINITNPAEPEAVSSAVYYGNGKGGIFYRLDGPGGTTTFHIGGSTYALVTSNFYDAIQVLDVTDPANPFDPLAAYVTLDTAEEPGHARYTGLEDDGHTLAFRYVVRDGDSTSDLAYVGANALHLGHNLLQNADEPADLTGLTLPVPGSPHSLSHNKDIAIDTAQEDGAGAFLTTWEADGPQHTISIPLMVHAGQTLTIDWGDGTISTVASSGTQSHTYDAAGQYTVSMTGGLSGLSLGSAGSTPGSLASIDQWGDIEWSSMEGAFRGASEMAYNATDAPDLSGVASMRDAFRGAAIFDGDISSWDVSSVTNMSYMFSGARSFNQPLDSWDVSSVTDMNGMFSGARSFNGDLSTWNVSSVTDMRNAFNNADSFNGDISDWDVSSVGRTDRMFRGATAFNGDISSWNVSSVTDMNGMFASADSFNRDISGWDTSAVTNMQAMFAGADSFNRNIPSWDTSAVTNMQAMFAGADSFNGNISGWDVSSVITMDSMFDDADSFNRDISGWNVSSVTDMSDMFYNADSFNGNISDWDVSSVTNMFRMFLRASSFNSDISGWNVSSVDDMSSMFHQASSFRQNLGDWYIVPGSTSINYDGAPGTVGRISAQNSFLDRQNPVYRIGSGGDSDSFEMAGDRLRLKVVPTKDTYNVTVTSTGDFGRSNSKTMNVTIAGAPANWLPAVDAGPDQTVPEGSTVHLNGTATDHDGDPLTYLWSHNPTGLAIAFENATAVSTIFTAPQVDADTIITLTLNVSDGHNAAVADHIQITITDDGPPDTAFVTTWQTAGANETVTIPVGGATGAYTIHWGDGHVYANVTGSQSHRYGDAGTHTVSITGDFTRIILADGSEANAQKLRSIEQWGDIRWESMERAFKGASNMAYHATDTPDLSGVASTHRMFADASSFDGDISSWDVSRVTDMSRMFRGATSFNQPLSSWNVSSVTNMASMFEWASSFNQPLSWNVSSVTDMAHMFYSATSFNGDVSSWDVSRVTDMGNMFRNATAFDGDISSWSVSSVADMSRMFKEASAFDGDISSWNVSGATNMYGMFTDASSFNGDLSGWDVSGVTNMAEMFDGAGSFEQNLGHWYIVLGDTSIEYGDATRQVTTISSQNAWIEGNQNIAYSIDEGAGDGGQFEMDGNALKLKSVPDGAKNSYNLTVLSSGGFGTSNSKAVIVNVTGIPLRAPDSSDFVTTWKTTAPGQSVTVPARGTYTIDWGDGTVEENVRGSQSHRYDSAGTHTVRISDGITGFHLNGQGGAGRLVSIDQWGTAQWASMHAAFEGASNMEYNAADAPDLSRVSDARYMFRDASSFNGDLSSWDVSSVTNMYGMFSGARSFNGNLSTWDVSSVTSMQDMFYYATSFNQPLDSWDVSSVVNMHRTFSNAPSFNQPLSSWNMSSVTTMRGMFSTSPSFNQPLDSWDVSSATNMRAVFYGTASFNQPLDSWNVSSATDMVNMFKNARSFNQPLSSWDVSSVILMHDMFRDARSFNQPLDSWNVSSVTDMARMFYRAASFNQPLDSWNVSSVTDMLWMFYDAPSFNQPLDSWDVSSVTRMVGMFSGAASFNQPLDSWNVSSVTNMGDMFYNASSFNQPLSSWDVSSVTSMYYMFDGATSFEQNLGNWHIVLDGTSIEYGDTPGIVGRISTQNSYLDGQNPTYGIGPGGDSIYFGLNRSNLVMKEVPTKDSYTVTITATSTGDFGTGNSRTFTIDVSGLPNSPPSVDAGPDQTVPEGSMVTLSGNATDQDAGDTLTYRWSQDPASPAIAFENATAASTIFTAPQVDANTTLALTLTVSDGTDTSSDTLNLTIADAPDALQSSSDFVTTWRTTTSNESITIPARGTYTIDWGDGTVEENVRGSQSHTYDSAGRHTVRISDGITGFHLDTGYGGARKLVSIDQWGTAQWASMRAAFEGAGNMEYRAADAPDLSRVSDASDMFRDASSFNGDLSSWNVSSVTNMADMFRDASSFNGDLSSWNVSSVTDMSRMFLGASSFNKPLSSWDVSSVTDMSRMFSDASSFNGDISGWDVSSVTKMNGMFRGASSFNQPLDSWNTSSVTHIRAMFWGAHSFNQPLDSWNTSSVTDMRSVFTDARSFNQPLDSWDVSSVTSLEEVFLLARSFNQPLNSWDVSSVTSLSSTFLNASSFNQPLNSWDVSSVTNMLKTFRHATSFNQDISSWDVSSVTSLFSTFYDARSFNQPLDSWDVSSVTRMDYTFHKASSFNQPLNAWDVSSVTHMTIMFNGASSFNQPLDSWDVSSVTRMGDMFGGATSFEQNLGNWHIVLDGTSIEYGDTPGTVGRISTQNSYLDGQNPTYGIGTGGDSVYFVLNGTDLVMKGVPAKDSYTVTITATSTGNFGTGNSRTFTIDVSGLPNSLPSVDAGADQTVPEGDTVTLNGTATGGDALTYLWSHDSPALPISLADQNAVDTTFIAPDVPANTTVTLTLTATDQRNATASDTVDISIVHRNAPPSVEAGPDQTVTEGQAVTLSGTASDDDGDALTYLWSQDPPSPAISLANRTAPSTTFAAPQVDANATIILTLTVSDGTDTSSDSMKLTITDVPDALPPPSAFVITWRTTANNESITIPVGGAAGTYTIDWGDGATSADVTGDQTHTYDTAGTYRVSISGDFARIHLNGDANAAKLQSIDQWGDITWESMEYAFKGASSMVYRAADSPDLSGTTSMRYMFAGAASFNGDISSWDVSSVTNMIGVFAGAASFNGDLSSWDVSRANDMRYMFRNAASFNGDLSSWKVSSAVTMTRMFDGAASFNGDLSSWDVSRANDMRYMFRNAASFNQPINSWDVSSVTSMVDMFRGASSFNQPLNSWNVSSVTSTAGMFYQASSFNQPLNAWDVSSVTSTADMFYGAASFNQPLNAWDVSSVTSTAGMFYGAASFNQPLSSWDVSRAGDMNSMFHGADSFDQNLGEWYIVPDDTTLESDDPTRIVGGISAQNPFLDGQNPTYGMGPGGDSGAFEINGASLTLKAAPTKDLYTVTITSAGGFGSDNSRTFNVEISNFNHPPTASAGADRTIPEGSTVALNGTATDADTEDTLTYLWTHDSADLGIIIDDANSLDTFFTAPQVAADTPVTFTLAVSDGTATASDQVTVTIADSANSADTKTINPVQANSTDTIPPDNTAPTASAGADQTVAEGSPVTLSGTASDDDGDTLTYLWTSDRPGITLTGPDTLTPSFTAPQVSQNTTITFTLSVSDGTNDPVTDQVVITVTDVPANTPPTASAGADKTVAEGSPVTLSGTASDDDGDTLTYLWTSNLPGLTLTGPGTLNPSFTAPQVSQNTTITFTLSVSDGTNDPVTDQATVTVTDTIPAPVEPPPETPADPRGISGLVLASTQPGTIRVTWDAPSETPGDYRVSWAKAGEAFLTWTDLDGNAFPTGPSHTITDLEGGEEYKVKVRARYDSGGPGDWSDVFTVTVAGTG